MVHLVDHQVPGSIDQETCWIVLSLLSDGKRVECEDFGRMVSLGDQLDERALAGLPRTHDEHDGSVAECSHHRLLSRSVHRTRR